MLRNICQDQVNFPRQLIVVQFDLITKVYRQVKGRKTQSAILCFSDHKCSLHAKLFL